MKKLLVAIVSCSLLWAGCKESNTAIDFGVKVAAAGDTTYVVSPVPVAVPHQVLVEEFTGQSCPNCPAGHDDLGAQSTANPGLINVVSMYAYVSPDAIPPAGSIHDFRDAVALSIAGAAIYDGVGGFPAAGFDRTPVSGNLLQIGSSSWANIILSQLGIKDDSVNISISSTYNTATNKATITAGVTYTHPVSTAQNISIVVVEDSMYDIQKDNRVSSGQQNNYLFLDVFRDMVTSAPFGDVLQVNGANTKEAGRFFQKVYNYTLPATSPAIVPAHCRVIAFVNNANGTDLHVMQSAQCKFAP